MFLHQNNQHLLVRDKRCLFSHWPDAFQFEMLMTTFVELLRGSRKKRNLGRSPTGRLSTAVGNSHMPFRAPAAPFRDLEKFLSERHGRSTAGAQHGHGMVCELNTASLCKSNEKDII
jgi:hypothetical protein